MKKIMFNDRYGLTQAVLEGRKTMTRRIVPQSVVDNYMYDTDPTIIDAARFEIGEEVAIAQRYSDVENLPFDRKYDIEREGKERAGWNNKMFVEAIYMPHHIRITDIKVERLQDISNEDCLKEGIVRTHGGYGVVFGNNYNVFAETIRYAYASLIDKVSGKGTWESNPWVFCYEFELTD